MPRVTFVKKARKDNVAVMKGESYYHWAFMIGGRGGPKHYSATRPLPSQLTSSAYLSQAYSLTESLPDEITTKDDWEALRDELSCLIEDLGSECMTSLDNMPEGLQQGDTGQLLQERSDACDNAIAELENIEFDDDDENFEFYMDDVIQVLDEVVI